MVIQENKDGIFDQASAFWTNYNQGRAQAPVSFFNRIFSYHRTHGGTFGTVHDVGAGNGPYAQRLKGKFDRVILSDIAGSAIDLAKAQLGTDGFEYRVARLEDASDIPAQGVDMVFATNVLHFADPVKGMTAIEAQVKPGGTFACACFGPARFEDDKLQDMWEQMMQQGGRQMLGFAERDGDEAYAETLEVMARSEGRYKVARLDEARWKRVQRIHLNMAKGGLVGLIPLEVEYDREKATVENGLHDEVIFEDDAEWSFETDAQGVKRHILSFPFIGEDDDSFKPFLQELEKLIGPGQIVRGVWPAKLILATRR